MSIFLGGLLSGLLLCLLNIRLLQKELVPMLAQLLPASPQLLPGLKLDLHLLDTLLEVYLCCVDNYCPGV